MKIPTEKKIRFGYGAAFFLLLIAFSYSVYTTDQLFFHIRWVSNTNKVLHNLEGLMLEVKDLDGTFRNGSKDTLTGIDETYQLHFNAIDSICEILRQETSHDYIPTRRLQNVKVNLDKLKTDIIPDLLLYDKKHKDTAPLTAEGIELLKKIEIKIADMHTAEKALLNLRSERLNNSTGSMKTINIIILIIALLLAGYSWLSYYNENTAKKRANNQITEYSYKLEKKVQELMNANTELIQLRSLQKFTSTGRIARMIAHEVRNPLTNINLSYDQLKDLMRNNDQASMLLETIIRNSNRINQLVSELLNATKAQELNFKSVSINTLLDETLEIARDRIELENILVKKEYDFAICSVKVDMDKIKIAFLNIILNAVEAMKPGTGILTIRTFSLNNKCVIKITDNGIGMDKDTVDKIFDPYYTGKSKGNGLGLTNTQNIILNHKGSIDVESEVGKGTSFIIELEFEKDD